MSVNGQRSRVISSWHSWCSKDHSNKSSFKIKTSYQLPPLTCSEKIPVWTEQQGGWHQPKGAYAATAELLKGMWGGRGSDTGEVWVYNTDDTELAGAVGCSTAGELDGRVELCYGVCHSAGPLIIPSLACSSTTKEARCASTRWSWYHPRGPSRELHVSRR